MRWDWYAATVPERAEAVLGALMAGQEGAEIFDAPGRHSYAQGVRIGRGEEHVAFVWWGGVNGEDSTHVQASGSATPAVVELIRSTWPEHRVARADVCEDWIEPRAWRWVSKAMLRVARAHGVKTRTVGDWFGRVDGRTLYVGAPRSRIEACGYEKGRQLGADEHWVRCELRVAPSGSGKSAVATAQPEQLMQSSRWTRDLAEALAIPELEAVRVRDPWRPSDDERSWKFLVQQWGGFLQRRASLLGGWPQLGEAVDFEISMQHRVRH